MNETNGNQASRVGRVLLVLAAVAVPAVALAHAVVYPKTSKPGAYEKYVLRVPNERDVPTIRVELRFPTGLRVVSFGDVAGWKLQVLPDTAQQITGAVWTGVLAKERFVEFPFVAVNPKGRNEAPHLDVTRFLDILASWQLRLTPEPTERSSSFTPCPTRRDSRSSGCSAKESAASVS